MKNARAAAAAKRKELRSPSPKEEILDSSEMPAPSPLDVERQKLMKQLEKSEGTLIKRLAAIEGSIGELEETYITSTWAHGNVIRGWDGYIRRVDRNNKNSAGNGSGSATGAPKVRKMRVTDRIFSLSSVSSHLRKEVDETAALKKSQPPKKKKKR